MSRPNLLAPRSPRSSCWERCTLVRRSRPRSPTGCGDGRCGMDRDDISNRDGCSCGHSIDAEKKESLDMNDMLYPNKMAEATRIPRAGRITEAVALLQLLHRVDSLRRPPFGSTVA